MVAYRRLGMDRARWGVLFGLAFVATSLLGPGAVVAQRPRLQFFNDSREEIEVFWIAPDGARVSNGRVADGQSRTIDTSIGHQFVIADGTGKDVAKVESRVPVQACRYQGPCEVDFVEGILQQRWPSGRVLEITPEMNLPAHYAKVIFSDGYPIVASSQVNDYALLEAAFLVGKMLAQRPDVRNAMIQSGSRLCIMGCGEFTTDLPEFRWLAKSSPVPGVDGRDYWDARARGLGGSQTDPLCSCAEENLLGFPGDPYAAENILIHEFAHNMHLRGLVNVDPQFDGRLKATYDKAMAEGLWKGKYASVNHHEYFAEGVQSWFNDNRENDHDHNHVNTREELIAYDPGLAGICREVFGTTELVYTKPATRLEGHLQGYQPDTAPRFIWPERLEYAKREIREMAERRNREANGEKDQ